MGILRPRPPPTCRLPATGCLGCGGWCGAPHSRPRKCIHLPGAAMHLAVDQSISSGRVIFQNREIFRAALPPFPETGEYPSVLILLRTSTRTREELQGVDFESQITRKIFDFFCVVFSLFWVAHCRAGDFRFPGAVSSGWLYSYRRAWCLSRWWAAQARRSAASMRRAIDRAQRSPGSLPQPSQAWRPLP